MKIKKTIAITSLMLLSLSLFAQEDADVYEDANIEISEVVTNKSKNKLFNKNQNNILKIGNMSFDEYDTTEVFINNMLNQLKKEECVFTYTSKNDNAGIGFPVTAAYYYIMLDEQSRNKFIIAGEQYFSDFEAKKLNRKDKKSFKKYGKTPATVYFGMIKTSAKNYSYPNATFGYKFYKDSPYFTIQCLPTDNIKYSENPSYPKQSNMIELYLTKAQLKNLMNLLSTDNINSCREQNVFVDKYDLSNADEY